MRSRSDPSSHAAQELSAIQANRAVAALRLVAHGTGGTTRLVDLVEGGGYRIKFPLATRGLEAVLVNTGGGLLGGDTLSIEVVAEADADVMITSQSAEKVYRAADAPSTIAVSLRAERGARLHWLPQEAILFSGAKLTRRIEADVADDAELIIAEGAVFGRLAMGEVLRTGLLADRWRIRRGERLAYAEDLRFDGDISAMLDRPALGGGARAAATLVIFAPDAEARVELARELAHNEGVSAGASGWDGRLVVRMLAADPAPLRETLIRLIAGLSGRPSPRFW